MYNRSQISGTDFKINSLTNICQQRIFDLQTEDIINPVSSQGVKGFSRIPTPKTLLYYLGNPSKKMVGGLGKIVSSFFYLIRERLVPL